MLVVLGFYKRRPDLTLEQFHDYWRNVHGPLGVNNPAFRKYCKRYVQHHLSPSNDWPGLGALEYDGFSESWYQSVADRKEMQRQFAENYPEILEDELNFIDPKATRIMMVDNQVVQLGKDFSSEWMGSLRN